MRNLIVCADGTWNTPDQQHDGVPTPTNVVRLYNAIADKHSNGNDQIKYYHPGVGTDGKWWDKLAGGAVGVGLNKNVMSAYKWLGTTYQPGDRIWLFGFSRGAYTVRSLAGMITSCGLVELSGLPDDDIWTRVEKVLERGYRKGEDKKIWGKDWKLLRPEPNKKITVFFLGVWDTVGALGIPDDMAILNLLDDTEKYSFHNTDLNSRIEHARHAVAVDEMRASFAPTLWTKLGTTDVKQIWFPGVHSDVGGGYPETQLSDGALKWMMDAAKAAGLEFHAGMYAQVLPDSRGVLHDSHSGMFKHMRTQPRSVPPVAKKRPAGVFHPSVIDRQRNPLITQAPYRPTHSLKKGGKRELPIFAINPWNDTGIYLEKGAKYEFKASGQWVDRNIKCGPGGTADGDFQAGELAHIAASAWGKVEGFFKKVSKNQRADFLGTKRVESEDWFVLLGAIANGGHPDKKNKLTPHEIFKIGDGCIKEPGESGYLYCFANDAWHAYDNNRGSVTLTVKRLA